MYDNPAATPGLLKGVIPEGFTGRDASSVLPVDL
jgi:hypothetical protein